MQVNQPLAITLVFCIICVSTASAAPPALKTPGTVIYLADNLDEADNLGWCIDTVGRGFAEQLHAHSCKPRGGDVQFGYDEDSKQIYSVEYAGKCMTFVDAKDSSKPFGLLNCETDNSAQKFVFNNDTGEIRLVSDNSMCVIVGQSSRSAGPFMSRDLLHGSCNSVDRKFRQWRQN